MLNMQNVKDIEITEGVVRTIHDKNNRLLWGRVAYDTKYAGDTFQQTYSGKNLISTLNATGEIEITGLNSFIANKDTARTANIYFPSRLPAGTYTISYDVEKNTVNTEGIRCAVFVVNESGTEVTSLVNLPSPYVGHKKYTFTSTTQVDRLYFFINNEMPSGSTATVTNLQVEAGSTATSYEPYVGGIPAPNPDYPQDIDVVAGEQTITISDGANAEDFTISLGSIELCKIGTYQDYIYKGGDDWYVHKAIKKMIFDGSSDENWDNLSNTKLFRIRVADLIGQDDGTMLGPILSNYYIATAYNNLSTPQSIMDYGVALRVTSTSGVGIKNIDVADAAGFKTWLSNNNTIVYAPFATPTDTKITDATLVGQLNAVHEWLTRYGYNSTVSGNLPIIINKTNL